MKLSGFQVIFLCFLFYILFIKNSLITEFTLFIKSFLRYIKKLSSNKK